MTESKTGENKGSSLRVLVVDDNIDAARTVALLLKKYGHDVRAVYDGPAALDAARGFQPNLIFLDIGLPGMNGYEVAQKVRADLELGNVMLVAMTGYGQEADKQRSREAGFDHHLVKPADINTIKQILASVSRAAT